MRNGSIYFKPVPSEERDPKREEERNLFFAPPAAVPPNPRYSRRTKRNRERDERCILSKASFGTKLIEENRSYYRNRA